MKKTRFIYFLHLAALISCANQKATLPGGATVENNQLFSKGGMAMAPDGSFVAFADSTEAAKHLGDFGRALLNAQLIGLAIGAAEGVAETVVEAVK
jgi:hypothetical protein